MPETGLKLVNIANIRVPNKGEEDVHVINISISSFQQPRLAFSWPHLRALNFLTTSRFPGACHIHSVLWMLRLTAVASGVPFFWEFKHPGLNCTLGEPGVGHNKGSATERKTLSWNKSLFLHSAKASLLCLLVVVCGFRRGIALMTKTLILR